jgi:hypothetical protein
LCAAVLAAVILPAAAEDQIIFSKPAGADAGAKQTPNLAPETKHESHALFNLPMTMFESHNPSEPALVGGGFSEAAPASSAQQKAWRQALKQKDEWTLMTPAEIVGNPTVEKILGLPAKNGEDKLTAEERFILQRQGKPTSGLGADDHKDKAARSDAPVPTLGGVFARQGFESVFAKPEANSQPAQPKTASGLKGFMNSAFAAAPKADSIWGNAFNLQGTSPKPALAPQAGMDRYRQMLPASAVMERAADPARVPTANTVRRDTSLDRGSPFNPLGNSFAPLRNESERPRGVTPLPSIVTRPIVTPKRPATAPALPPWMRDDGDKMESPLRRF